MIKHCPDCPSERLILLDSAKKTEEDDNGIAADATDAPPSLHSGMTGLTPLFFDDYHCLDCGYEFSCRRSGEATLGEPGTPLQSITFPITTGLTRAQRVTRKSPVR
jgi:hypothetical protein